MNREWETFLFFLIVVVSYLQRFSKLPSLATIDFGLDGAIWIKNLYKT